MFCKKCGTEIMDVDGKCPQCGFVNSAVVNAEEKEMNMNEKKSEENIAVTGKASKKLSNWCWGAIVSVCCAIFTFYKGVDKMINYNSGEYYPYRTVNAYVGGDAYNYIINGTYATAFFVLTAMFLMTAIGLVIIHYVSRK